MWWNQEGAQNFLYKFVGQICVGRYLLLDIMYIFDHILGHVWQERHDDTKISTKSPYQPIHASLICVTPQLICLFWMPSIESIIPRHWAAFAPHLVSIDSFILIIISTFMKFLILAIWALIIYLCPLIQCKGILFWPWSGFLICWSFWLPLCQPSFFHLCEIPVMLPCLHCLLMLLTFLLISTFPLFLEMLLLLQSNGMHLSWWLLFCFIICDFLLLCFPLSDMVKEFIAIQQLC